MTDPQDDFERRFAEDFRAYLAEGVPKTDASAVASDAMTRAPRRAGWGRTVAGVASVLITALAVVAIVFVRAGVPLVGSSPSPAALGSATPKQAPAEPGPLRITCQGPVVPGWCLQPLAWAIEHLPAGHAGVATVTIMPINLCPTASPCYGPPHRDESWVAFTLRDGSSLGMWVVRMMGIPYVQSVEAGGTPPPSAEPVTGAFTLECGDIPDATCAGAAAGTTAVVPNKPPRTVLVQRGESDRYLVTLTYQDGTQATTAVAPDPTRYMGWSPVTPTAPPPSPAIVFTCPPDGSLAPFVGTPVGLPASFCPAEEVAVQTATAKLGYEVRSITILPGGFPCGSPFMPPDARCPAGSHLVPSAAYVTFTGTDKVAALTLDLVTNGPVVATVVTFQVPPSGWIAP